MDLGGIQSLVTPEVEALGYRVVVIELAGGRRSPVLRVFIEHADESTRISLDDCVRVSRRLGALEALDAMFPASYHLEVSSPGVDRRLMGERDFRRFQGKRARVCLVEPRDGRRWFTGRIACVEQGVVRLEVGGETGVVSFRLDEVSRANLKPERTDLFEH